MLSSNLWFKANYHRNVLGKVSYLLFKAKFHGYNSIYFFMVNVT